MEKEKQTAKPQEVECPRPDLYIGRFSENIWLKKSNGSVVVKIGKPGWLYIGDLGGFVPPIVGAFASDIPNSDTPKYTGPIDDETMANILIYG